MPEVLVDPQPLSVLVTGANGNIGRKLMHELGEAPWCRRVTGVDAAPGFIEGDLLRRDDARWLGALQGVNVVLHLAAQNPYPDASWSDATASVDMTLNLVAAARAAGVRRLVFASSNHVMGGYKEAGLPAGGLSVDLPPRPGTRFRQADGSYQDSTPYATAKLMNERICLAAAAASGGAFTAVCLRIGWCRPGDNRPEEISLEVIPGVTAAAAPDAESLNDLRWARDMWLSNRNMLALMTQAARVDARGWPGPGIVVNANSGNRGMPWDRQAAARWLGYAPQDDLYSQVQG